MNNRLLQIKYVVDNSEYVKININNLKKYLDTLNIKENTYWLNGINLNISEREYILLMFIIESMNFCFWKEPYIEKIFMGVHHKKSMALFYSVIDKVLNDNEFLDINNLINITREDLLSILGGNPDMPLVDERYENLIETINIINDKGDTFYTDLFSKKTDNELLEYIVSEFPCFRDVGKYNDREILFYKRATLLTHDLFEVSKTINNNIKSVDNLLGCADYGIPRTLRYHGILEYSKDLSEFIDNKMLILSGSKYEIEIRANMLYVLELIKEELKKRNIIVNSISLDNIIWITGRNISGEHHRTETIYY